jgi:hypothetical protein
VHALYFVTPELVEQFVDADGQALGSDAVLGTNSKGDTVLKTPRVSVLHILIYRPMII